MRAGLRDDLANLWLQVEVMALWAGTAVESACRVATSGDNAIAAAMIASDDEIDAMQMPLTEKCAPKSAALTPPGWPSVPSSRAARSIESVTT